MKLELHVNGKLHDAVEWNWSRKDAANALKAKWWFLLAKSDWEIHEVRQSKMNWSKSVQKQTADV